MSFFTELKRRNVFRVGIAYAVVAWLVMQFADVVLNNITAPGWVFQVIMLLLFIGFPVVLVFAWAFEMTPEGLKKEKDIDRSNSIAPQTGRKLDRTIIVVLVLALAYFAYDKFSHETLHTGAAESAQAVASNETHSDSEPPPRSQSDKSVAVLPFAFRSTNQEDEFFAEGMHDDLLTQLAKIGSLKVISRTSVMEYKDTTKKIPEIAAELGVATIVEGGVQRSGSRIRFNAQLIDARTDEHLWAETYDRELTAENLFDIQAEIARAIAQALQATLSPEEEANIDRVLTGNLEAWESFQRAVRIRQTINSPDIQAGIAEIDHALELDPDFAAAWGLKAILLLQQYWFFDTDTATRDAAWQAIQNGRTIDPAAPELDMAEGYYHYWGFRDYEKALPYMQKACAALPNNSRAHLARAYVLRRMGDWDNALAAFRRASELDPRRSTTINDIGGTLTGLRRFDEARKMFLKSQEIDPDDPNGLWEKANLELQSSGNIMDFARLTHLLEAPHPDAQQDVWHSSLYKDDYAAALQDVAEWPERYLDTKDYRITRPYLTGMTHRYFGDVEKARPLLHGEQKEFETLLKDDPQNYPVLRSLCFIAGGLGDKALANRHCEASLQAAPGDAFLAGRFLFDAAAGLALAGETESSIRILKEMLDGETGPTMHKVIHHPAFDGIRENEAYINLVEQYGPGDKQR